MAGEYDSTKYQTPIKGAVAQQLRIFIDIAQKVTLSIQITVIECECIDFSSFDLNVSC